MVDPIERFLSHVIDHSDRGQHWYWKNREGATRKRPGFCLPDGTSTDAARAGYLLMRGPIPEGFEASHQCGDGQCVNPWHLISEPMRANRARDRISHCPQGHELTPENRLIARTLPSGVHSYKCRICHNERVKLYGRRKRQERSHR